MYWTVLCYHPYLVSMLFADLLSLHLATFLYIMFLILLTSLFFSSRCMHAWVEVYHLLQSSKSSLTGFLWVLAEESQAFFKHSQHTNSISNSVILHNNYNSLLRFISNWQTHTGMQYTTVMTEYTNIQSSGPCTCQLSHQRGRYLESSNNWHMRPHTSGITQWPLPRGNTW